MPFLTHLGCFHQFGDTVKKQLSRKIPVKIQVALQACVNENSYVSEWKNGWSWRTKVLIFWEVCWQVCLMFQQFTHSLYLSLLCKIKHFFVMRVLKRRSEMFMYMCIFCLLCGELHVQTEQKKNEGFCQLRKWKKRSCTK